jgi:hypothetical protein
LYIIKKNNNKFSKLTIVEVNTIFSIKERNCKDIWYIQVFLMKII